MYVLIIHNVLAKHYNIRAPHIIMHTHTRSCYGIVLPPTNAASTQTNVGQYLPTVAIRYNLITVTVFFPTQSNI